MNSEERLRRYFAHVATAGLYRNVGNLRFYLDFLFRGVEFRDARVLDVGAGAGLLGIYAACRGAERVICLEPESAGSSAGMQASFARLAAACGASEARLLPTTLQDYDYADGPFDIVVMHNSINHLDEERCIRLHRDPEARSTYRRILQPLHRAMSAGSTLVAADCSRRNLFGDLGIRNPFARAIEWHKHQNPSFWGQLLVEVGFGNPRIRWMSYNSLRGLGRIALGNRIAGYCLTGHFCLTMTRGSS